MRCPVKMNLKLKAKNIGDVRDWFDVHRIYAMSSAGKITEIGWETETSEKTRIDADSIEIHANNVWFRDPRTGKQLRTLDACCIVGIEIADSTGAVYSIEHCFEPVWCFECVLSEGDDFFSFESDTSRNLWQYVKDAIFENEDPLHERCVEEIECAAYESFIHNAPSYAPRLDDLKILFALAKYHPRLTVKKTGTQI